MHTPYHPYYVLATHRIEEAGARERASRHRVLRSLRSELRRRRRAVRDGVRGKGRVTGRAAVAS